VALGGGSDGTNSETASASADAGVDDADAGVGSTDAGITVADSEALVGRGLSPEEVRSVVLTSQRAVEAFKKFRFPAADKPTGAVFPFMFKKR
jgi:hypothetical protein